MKMKSRFEDGKRPKWIQVTLHWNLKKKSQKQQLPFFSY